MCYCVCVSFRGASYFGTSCQILLGLALFVRCGLVVLLESLDFNNDFTLATMIIILTYSVFVMAFGMFIFRAIESESVQGLKVAVGGFTFLQILLLITHFLMLALMYEDFGVDTRFTLMALLVFNLLFTFLHLTILFLYIGRLTKRMLAEESELDLTSHSGGGNGVKPPYGFQNNNYEGQWENLRDV